MKSFISLLAFMALSVAASQAASVNWAAGIDNGLSLSSGTNVPVGSLVRIGHFRDPNTGVALTDAQILSLAGTPALLDASFVEIGHTTIGSGFSGSIAGHFASSSTADTGAAGLNIAGRQMAMWVLDSATLNGATQQAIFYWDTHDTTTNPDNAPQAPGFRWSVPAQDPLPGSTSIDITDLTSANGSALAAGAHLLVGTFPTGTSVATGSANIGLAAISSPLTIATTSPIQGGALGSAYSLTFAASGGTAPDTWSLASGSNDLPAGLTLSSAGALTGTPTATGTTTFTVKVVDSVSTTVTKDFSLTIASQALSVTTSSPLPNATAGVSYTTSLSATGGTGSYTWKVTSGTLPQGITLGTNGTFSGSASAATTASFTVEVTDSTSVKASKAMSLTVLAQTLAITTPSPLSSGVVTHAYSQTFTATGGAPAYHWSVAGGALPAGFVLSDAGLLTGSPTLTSSSSFTLQVMDSSNSVQTKAFTLSVLAAVIIPVMDVPVFPVTTVSVASYTYTLTASNYPTAFTVTGLPAGLTYNIKTFVISGHPTVSGVFMVQVKASNKAGTSPTVTSRLTVQALPPGVIGTYVGTLTRQQAVNNNVGGRIDLTTTATGYYSCKITEAAKVYSFTGYMVATVGGGSPQILSTQGTVAAPLPVILTLNPSDNTVMGTMGVVGATASVNGWRRVWSTAANPAYNQAGYYTMGLDITSGAGDPNIPQGSGYVSFTVGLDGGLTLTGRTADGNVISVAGFLGPRGEVAVYQPLYVNLGSLLGQCLLTPDATGSFDDNTVTGSVSLPLTWLKPANTALAYTSGFGPITLSAYGKYLAYAAKGSVVLGLPDFGSNTAALSFDDDGLINGLASSAVNPDIAAFTYSDVGKVTMPTLNPGKTTLGITLATGAVGGTFTLVNGSVVRTVAYQGLIIRPAAGPVRAAGYYLLPELPTAGKTLKTSPQLSGKVTISQ